MASLNYGYLPPAEEDALHASRLLAIEERPFQRVTRRLLDRDSLLRTVPAQLPSPPPEGEDTEEIPIGQDASDKDAQKRQTFFEEVLLDFANLESSITRIQLIHDSNIRERERYAEAKQKIEKDSRKVRESTLELRTSLVEAQKVLQLRKGYDELALKVLADKKLKSREEASNDIAALEKEIEELEAESKEVDGLWVGRKEQFEKIVHEGEVMRRIIKGIKQPEEVEADEGDEDEAMEGVDGPEDRSRLGSPAVGGTTPRPRSGGATPLAGDEDIARGEATPLHADQDESSLPSDRPRNKFVDVVGGTRSSSRAASPSRVADVEMEEGDLVEAKSPAEQEATGASQAAEPAPADQEMDES
ncbi:hypothetical protein B0A48_03188 [Cryoendolithus antarcticus]|uniref:Tho complex subunit 7 n=1 Tax=Cryoendolithus antarcticus TaxID=1507870 RepID=A0A1V8TJP0_9PEZI|nr:hypothetical protein B0A48_03188 [Cryoendolithus antarcticus]